MYAYLHGYYLDKTFYKSKNCDHVNRCDNYQYGAF